MLRFLKIDDKTPRWDGAKKRTIINLDAILYTEDYGVEGEPVKVFVKGQREGYYLVNEEAKSLLKALEERLV